MSAGDDFESLSWSELADRAHLCPSSPDYSEPHIVTDDSTCDECGATVEADEHGVTISQEHGYSGQWTARCTCGWVNVRFTASGAQLVALAHADASGHDASNA